MCCLLCPFLILVSLFLKVAIIQKTFLWDAKDIITLSFSILLNLSTFKNWGWAEYFNNCVYSLNAILWVLFNQPIKTLAWFRNLETGRAAIGEYSYVLCTYYRELQLHALHSIQYLFFFLLQAVFLIVYIGKVAMNIYRTNVFHDLLHHFFIVAQQFHVNHASVLIGWLKRTLFLSYIW